MASANLDVFTRFLLKQSNGRIVDRRPLDRVPRLSVVIPCYNYGRYLTQCVASVTSNQPGVDVEVIIVDDKSTDDSLAIASQLAAADPRIRLIANERNKGHIATFNEGVNAATGEFVLLISADDLVTPGALTRACELFLAQPSVGLVYGSAIDFVDALPPNRQHGEAWIIWDGVDWLRQRCRSGFNVVASPEVVMRTSVLRSFGGYRPDIGHASDFEMWLRTSAVSDVGFLIGVDQAYYRHHALNMNKRDFAAGTASGQLIDIDQRWRSFIAVFDGVGSNLPSRSELHRLARETMSRQVMDRLNYAYARGYRDFPVKEFEKLALEIDQNVARTRAGRAYARRKKLGMISLPVHPLWAPAAVMWRVENLMRRWRCRRIGI